MIISVAMATYNGEKYIYEQLESINNQTRKVDEVIISDDGSADNTILICETYIKQNNLKNWKIVYNNNEKHGIYFNFCNAMKSCSGDYIVLCDQDDIWLPYKIEELEKIIQEKRCDSLASNYSRFKDDIELCDKQLHPHIKKNGVKHISLKEFCHFYNYLGMTMIVNKKIIKQFLSMDLHSDYLTLSHDIILNFLAIANDQLFFYDKVLTKRRSYETSTSYTNNQNDYKKLNYTNRYAYQMYNKYCYVKMFEKINNCKKIDKAYMKKISNQYYVRAEYIEKKNLFKWMINIMHINLYDGISDYVKDFFRMKIWRRGNEINKA